MIFMVTIHASRVSDLERPDLLTTTASVPIEGYRDSFGNWCNRLVAPAGRFTVKTDTIVCDAGVWDAFDLGAHQVQVQNLPADTLQFLLGSRYCETDRLSAAARKLFGQTPLGGAQVQAIFDYVHESDDVRVAQAGGLPCNDRASDGGTDHMIVAILR